MNRTYCLMLLLLLYGCSTRLSSDHAQEAVPIADLAQPDYAVARYNGGEIMAGDVDAFFELYSAGTKKPFEAYRLAADDAQRELLELDITTAIEEIVWSRIMPYVPAVSINMREVEQAYMNCRMNSYKALMLDAIQPPMDEQLRPIFEASKDELGTPESRTLRYIFFARPEDGRSRGEELKVLAQRIRDNELSFGQAAFQFSDAPSSSRYGYVGNITPGSGMNQAFLDAVIQAPVAQVSDIVELQNGWYLFFVEKINSAVPCEFGAFISEPSRKRILIGNYYAEELIGKLQLAAGGRATSEREMISKLVQANDFTTSDCERIREMDINIKEAVASFRVRRADKLGIDEEEIRNYYEQRPEEMRASGLFRLAVYRLPLQSSSQNPASRAENERRLQSTRDELATKGESTSLLAGGIDVIQPDEWIQGTGVAEMDQELLRLEAGQYTHVYSDLNGSFFSQLIERRTPPLMPLEKVHSYIEQTLSTARHNTVLREEISQTMKEKELVHLWKQ